MKKYIGKRIINFLIVLVGVSILSFLLIAWSGKDPAEIIAHRGVSNPTPEQIEMIRVEMGLDQPLPVRYIQWLSGMFTGELGTSLTTHQPIACGLLSSLCIIFFPHHPWTKQTVDYVCHEICDDKNCCNDDYTGRNCNRICCNHTVHQISSDSLD
mgnify:CR=1 FL=1